MPYAGAMMSDRVVSTSFPCSHASLPERITSLAVVTRSPRACSGLMDDPSPSRAPSFFLPFREALAWARPSGSVDERERRLKKRRESERLRALPPERTLEMGFSLTNFARELAAAADRARR